MLKKNQGDHFEESLFCARIPINVTIIPLITAIINSIIGLSSVVSIAGCSTSSVKEDDVLGLNLLSLSLYLAIIECEPTERGEIVKIA
nr:hypothetical protein [Methanosarcina horonobensis]